MRRIGFSTGALARGDFQRGIELQIGHADAVELSALREAELDPLIEALPHLPLEQFEFVSFHAPGRRAELSERQLIERLANVAASVDGIIVHPDIIEDPAEWLPIQGSIFLENMDQRKPIARTAEEMRQYFDALPKARFCLDLGHARQVDPTLTVAMELLRGFGERLAEIHISEVDALSSHVAISSAARKAFRRISPLIPKHVPTIVESIIEPEAIVDEIRMARESLGDLVVPLSDHAAKAVLLEGGAQSELATDAH